MTKERAKYNEIRAKLDAACLEHDAAQQAYDDYCNNPANWKSPDWNDRREKLFAASCAKAAKAREISARLDEARKSMVAVDPAFARYRQLADCLLDLIANEQAIRPSIDRMTQINDTQFSTLWGEALTAADRAAYISDWSLSSIWEDDPESEIPRERIDHLGRIWDAAHMDVREIVVASGLKQTAFATRYCIPYRTVQNWCSGVSKCPDYVRLLLIRALGLL